MKLKGEHSSKYMCIVNWKEEIKDFRSNCRARPINPKLYQAVKDDFQRLRGYFYVPSDSKVKREHTKTGELLHK